MYPNLQGGYQMGRIHIHLDRCVGCRYCMLVCSVNKCGFVRPACSRIQIERNERTGDQLFRICRQCDAAPCIQVCPGDALIRGRDGLVEYHPDLCLNCRACQAVCPFNGIWAAPGSEGMVKCDLCKGQPVCIAACPVNALEVI